MDLIDTVSLAHKQYQELIERYIQSLSEYELPVFRIYRNKLDEADSCMYLNLIKSRLTKLKLPFEERDSDNFIHSTKHDLVPFVADRKTFMPPTSFQYNDCDLDCILHHDGIPSVTEATFSVIHMWRNLYNFKMSPNVIIIGRGYATSKLPQMLLNENMTVSVCHSHTTNITTLLKTHPDIVVVGSPKIGTDNEYMEIENILESVPLIIDLSGVCEKYSKQSNIISNIGKLTIDELIYRYLVICERMI